MSTAFERFDARPARLAYLLAVVPALAAVVTTATRPLALVLTALGTVVVLSGLRLASRDLVTVGTLALFGGVVFAGVLGAPVPFVMVGAAAAIVAWDAATNAISLAGQLGGAADTRSVQLVHTLATTVMALLVGIGAMVIYLVGRGGEPTTAVVMLLLAAVLFVVLLDA